ncbi:MAG: hypothetical protein ACWGHH_06395 [Sulfurovaceae bacterium]
MELGLFFKAVFSFFKNGLAWVLESGYRIVIVALLGFIAFMYIGQWSRDKEIKNLGADLNKSKGEYKLLLGQHKNLADAVDIQNAAIDKMKTDEAKAEKEFKAEKTSITKEYEALVAKYKDTPQDKKCAVILERNRKYYQEDKGVGYEEN